MTVRLHPHAVERLSERGATEAEMAATVQGGESFPAKSGVPASGVTFTSARCGVADSI